MRRTTVNELIETVQVALWVLVMLWVMFAIGE